MEPIQNAMKKLSKDRDFDNRLRDLEAAVYPNEKVQKFLQDHPEVTNDMLNRSSSKLFEFVNQSVACDGCSRLEECRNIMKGYEPALFVNRDRVDVHYKPCPYKIQRDQKKRQESLFRSLYVPKEIAEADMGNLNLEQEGRAEAIERADEYIENFRHGKTATGLYFYGDFGVGKSFMAAAVANELVHRKGVQTLMVYTPDFFRDMKSSIQDQSVDEKLNYIKKVPLLILDDIGAETVTSWIRDDLLGTILQYRMMEQLPTLYTSNYDYHQLEDHLAYSHKSGTEQLKAKRIMERIRHLTTPIKVGGVNQRSIT